MTTTVVIMDQHKDLGSLPPKEQHSKQIIAVITCNKNADSFKHVKDFFHQCYGNLTSQVTVHCWCSISVTLAYRIGHIFQGN